MTLVPLAEAEIRKILEKAKAVARSRGYPQIADDFAQEAYIAIAGGRQTTFDNLLIDYLRAEYGRTRPHGGRPRQSRLSLEVSIDEVSRGGEGTPLRERLPSAGVDPGTFGPNWRDRIHLLGCDALIYELRFEDELSEAEIGEMFGVTESRICQIIKSRIEPVVTAAFVVGEVADIYADDPEYSKLLIDWIAI